MVINVEVFRPQTSERKRLVCRDIKHFGLHCCSSSTICRPAEYVLCLVKEGSLERLGSFLGHGAFFLMYTIKFYFSFL